MRRLLVMRSSMIAPNGEGAKGFALGLTVTQVAEAHDHAFVRPFIIPPKFGPAPVHLDRHKTITGFGSARVSDSSAPSPPELVPADSFVFVPLRFNPLRFGPAQAGPFF